MPRPATDTGGEPPAAPPHAHLVCGGGASPPATRDEIRRRRDDDTFLWLDLASPGEEEIALLAEEFGFHPLALEDSAKFGQRPKIEEYEGHLFIVAFGYGEGDQGPVEVHCFLGPGFLVTIRRVHCPPLTALRTRFGRNGRAPEGPMALHAVLDALTDSFFPVLAAIDERIEDLDEALLEGGEETQRTMYGLKRRLVAMSRLAGPQRDMVGKIAGGIVPVPSLTREDERYFRDVYDHLLRIEDMTVEYRDLLNGATEVMLASVNNRLNGVMKQLAVIATIFLPLTFVTGFFGQNFGWMVRNVGGLPEFLVLGIGTQVAAIALLVAWFRRQGWL